MIEYLKTENEILKCQLDGRRPRLTDGERRRLAVKGKALAAVVAGPQAQGHATAVLTLPRVAKLIEQRTGQRYHPGHVWRILSELGFSCQQPTRRAIERDETAIADWKRVTWPGLKKSPARRPHHRFRRRKRTEHSAAPGAHVGAARPNAGAARDLQLG